MEKVRVEGTPFARDMGTKALLTVDRGAIAENEARKKIAARINGKDQEINNLKERMDVFSNDLTEIKELLKALTNKG